MEMPAGKELREASNQQMEGTEALNPTACNHVSLDVDPSPVVSSDDTTALTGIFTMT